MMLDVELDTKDMNILNGGGFLKMVLGDSGICVTITKDICNKEDKENDID